MGHQVLKCDFCNRYVMEGRESWVCDCKATCSKSTKWEWIREESFEPVIEENKECPTM